MVLGVEDDEKITQYPKEAGELQAKFLGLGLVGAMAGKVRIDVEESIGTSKVSILMGGTNCFEHYLLNRLELIFKVPNGN